jgi:hypothetical protein
LKISILLTEVIVKMNIGLDFDGVIANSHPVKSEVARDKYGVEIPPERLRREPVISAGLLTREQYIEMGAIAMGGSYEIPPVHEALMYIPALINHGYELRIITSRSDAMLDVAEKWLKRYAIAMPVCGVGYRVPKNQACQGLDVYVDDDLEKLLPLVGVVPHLLFFSWPWNAHEKEPAGITRVESWYDIYHHVRYEIQSR